MPLPPLLLLLPCLLLAQYVEDSIDVGGRWIGSMVCNSRENVVYGRSQSSDVLFAIDCSSNQVVSRVEVEFPCYLAYSATSNKVYCTFRPSDTESLLVVDGVTHQRIRAMPMEWAAFPVWDSVANRLFVSCTEANRVTVIDCAADTVIKRIQTSAGPMRMHLNNRHRKLYVQCYDSERLNIIDLETLEVIENIRVPGYPEAGCYSEVADKYYCGALSDIVVVDGVGDSVVAEIGLTGRALSMVAVDRHSLVLVGYTYAGSDSVHVINVDADSIVRTFPGVSVPHGLHWSEATDLVYCASSRWDQIAVIAGDGSRMLDVLQVGAYPFCFAAAPRHQRLYMGHLGSRFVYVIRDTVSGIAEMPKKELTEPQGPTMLSRAQLQTELLADPSLSLFDASGRLVLNPESGVHFIRQEDSGTQGSEGSSVRKIVIHR